MSAKKPKRKVSWSTVAVVAALLVGLCLLAYPSVSDWWNRRVTSRAVASYVETVDAMDGADIDAIFEAAEAYNAHLLEQGTSFLRTELPDGYEDLLDITGTGIMGYLTIEELGVSLPIYHGTSEGVLQVALGHLEGSSLPVGGEGTHAAISGHRGLPSARLFTDIDQLEEGDRFSITVLDRTFTYQVDQVRIVEPADLDELRLTEGEDRVTLVTCTPYGVNSHRLLVRGTRVTTGAAAVTAGATEVNAAWPALVAAALAALLIVTCKRGRSIFAGR